MVDGTTANPGSAFFRICAASLVGFMGMGCAFQPTMSLYARHLNAPLAWIGAIIGVGSFLGIFIRLPAGALSSVLGRKKLLVAGASSFVLAPLFVVLFPDRLWAIFLMSLVYGIATLYMPAAIAYVHDIYPESDRGRHLSYYTMFGGMGRAAGPIVAGLMLKHFSYTDVYSLCVVLGFLAFGLTLLVPSVQREAGASVFGDLKAVVSDTRLFVASLARMVQSSAQGALFTFFPIYGREVAQLSEEAIGYLIGTNHIVSLLCRPVTAVLSSRAGRVPFMVLGMIVQGGSLVLVVLAENFWVLLPLFALTGISEAVVQIATISYVADVAKKKLFGASIGIVGAMFDVGLVAGKLIPGWLIPLMGYPPAFAAIAACIAGFSVVVGKRCKELPLT